MLYTRRNLVLLATTALATLLILRSLTWSFRDSARRRLAQASNATLGFQEILVVNLPQRTDRRDAMTLAATVTGLKLRWIPGHVEADVVDKALPADSGGKAISGGNKGSWRGHMDALQRIVEQGLTTALILEDDVDWDIRLKSQTPDFADMSQTLLHANPTDPSPAHSSSLSAYGSGWDVLWLGHCGTDLIDTTAPFPHPPSARVARYDDATVPQHAHLRPHPFAEPDAWAAAYPAHTRLAHHANGTRCTLAYAVSQRGARRLLWQFGLRSFTTGWDLMLGDWCAWRYEGDAKAGLEGVEESGKGGGQTGGRPVCVTVQPPLFGHWLGKGTASDITAPGGGFISTEKEVTPYIRVGVRMNLERLVRGEGMESLKDQWPDEDVSLEST